MYVNRLSHVYQRYNIRNIINTSTCVDDSESADIYLKTRAKEAVP